MITKNGDSDNDKWNDNSNGNMIFIVNQINSFMLNTKKFLLKLQRCLC